jgi:hypothetical protein
MGTYTELVKQQSKTPTVDKKVMKLTQEDQLPTQDTQVVSQEITQETSQVISKQKRKVVARMPSKDEVEEFNWKLRRERFQKFTTDIPSSWLKELNDMAYEMDVKKIELYRYMIAEFLWKVKRRKTTT